MALAQSSSLEFEDQYAIVQPKYLNHEDNIPEKLGPRGSYSILLPGTRGSRELSSAQLPGTLWQCEIC